MDYNWNHTSGITAQWETEENKKEKDISRKKERAASLDGEKDSNTDRSKGMKKRTAEMIRKTKETDIRLSLNIDGSGQAEIETGIGFFDHMLNSFARHGLFDLKVECKGDLYVDCHHTIEDVGIVLGMAIKEAVGDKAGIKRYGSFLLPMDETLVLCALDLSGRAYLNYQVKHPMERVGYFDTEMVKEFFQAVSSQAGMNLHMKLMDGENTHHIIEAEFKAFAKALDESTRRDERIQDVLSTKGTL